VILTDESGVPFERPCREDYADTGDFLRAFHAYKDAVANCANLAFAYAFQDAMRPAKRNRRAA
jgi:hypothetical protein